MTGAWSPLRSSMASPYLYSTPIAERTLRQGTPMASGDGQLCEIPAAQGAAGCLELVCLAPGQSDFGSIDISTAKDALGSMHCENTPRLCSRHRMIGVKPASGRLCASSGA